MNVVDSCGWLEYFANGPNAGFFAASIEDTKNLLVPVICVFEVFKRIYQQRGEDAALQAIALMHQGEIVALDGSSVLQAAKCSIDQGLPMADSIILSVALSRQATLWTQDKDFEKIEGIKYVEKT